MTFSPRSPLRRSAASSSAKQARSMFAPRPFAIETDTPKASSSDPDRAADAQPNLQARSLPQTSINFASLPLRSPTAAPPVQAKLTIGAPGDKYEQEADRTAAQVMRMPDPPVQRETLSEEEEEAVQMKPIAVSSVNAASLQQKCSECEQEVQRSGDGTAEAGSDIESRLNSSKGGGQPLSNEVRSFMEPRFGADFSQVRTHTGGEAVQMNQAIGAQAFTHGNNIYFGAGKSPANSDLTAHELTHVIQQAGGVQTKQSSNISSTSQSRIQRWFGDDEETESESESSGGITGWIKEKASGAVDSVVETGGAAIDWAEKKGNAAVETVTQTGSEVADWFKEKGSDIGEMLPDMPDIDLDSVLAQASQQVIEKTQEPKLPRLQEAQALLERADSVLISNVLPGSVDPDLPSPTTGADTNQCTPLGTVQSMRVSLDGACTNLANAVTTFQNAQKATKIACEQGTRICYGALAAGALAPLIAMGGPGAIPVILAACIACMGGAYPVQNAIRVEMETYDALLPAMESLKKSLANYQTAALGNRRCPDYVKPIDPMK